jgi:hypothetical protein
VLTSALHQPRFASLGVTLRAEVERALRSEPVARAEGRVLLAAAALTAALAGLGLLLIVFGPLRDRALEADLHAQGVGPGATSKEAVARLAAAAALGVLPGVAIAVVLSVLSVGAVGRASPDGQTWPPLVAVLPWPELVAWALLVAALPVLVGTALLATRRRLGPGGSPHRRGRDRLRHVPQGASR